MKKIQTSLQYEFGSKRATAFGQLEFDDKGQVEISDEEAMILVDASPSLSLVSEETDTEVKGLTETNDKEANDKEAQTEETEETQTEETVIDFNSMKISELKEVLIESGVSVEELKSFKGEEGKAQLIERVKSLMVD